MANPIYELMYRGESGEAGYNAYNRGTYVDGDGRERIRPGNPPMDFSRFTLGEIQDMQDLPRRDPDRVFAIGKYQMIPDTMDEGVARLGLARDQRFTPELQDRLFTDYLMRKQPGVAEYIEGKQGATLEQAQHGLAREWASFGDPEKGGRSYHGGANQAHVTLEQSSAALTQMRTGYAAAIERGASPDEAWRAATAVDPAARRTQSQPSSEVPQSQERTQRTPATLKQGTQGSEVWGLQTTLHGLGYTGADGRALATDKHFGPNTDHAVRAFQTAHGLEPVDGKVGPDTRDALTQAAQHPLVSEATHPNHALFEAISGKLPAGTDPRVTANVTLQALENGITGADKLGRVDVSGSDAFVQGTVAGDRAKVDLTAPTPTLQQMSDHMAQQSQLAQQPPLEQQRTQILQ